MGRRVAAAHTLGLREYTERGREREREGRDRGWNIDIGVSEEGVSTENHVCVCV